MKRNVHAWNDRTQDDEKREWRVSKFGRKWTFQSKVRGEEFWTTHDPLAFETLVAFRDLLWRKYQRRRAPYEDWFEVDRIVKDRERAGEKVPERDPADGPLVLDDED